MPEIAFSGLALRRLAATRRVSVMERPLGADQEFDIWRNQVAWIQNVDMRREENSRLGTIFFV